MKYPWKGMKRPYIAMDIETTLWPIPYWIRKIAIRRVDKYLYWKQYIEPLIREGYFNK